jgi:hypothetical protein
MAYAACREHPGVLRTHAAMTPSFRVLDVTVCCADALRVRLMIRLPLASYAEVLRRLIDCVPSGEIGRLVSWREYLARCGLHHGH